MKTYNRLCMSCRFTAKGLGSTCSNCGSNDVIIYSSRVRAPKKNASKSKWKKFLNRFIYPIVDYKKLYNTELAHESIE